jgi:NAD(P)H-hydrate epimerase
MVEKHIGKFSQRKKESHKGNYGRILVLAGAEGMTGAAFLSCQGALSSGSGLVVNGIPKSLNQIMEIKLTEVMTLPLEETSERTLSLSAEGAIIDAVSRNDVIVLGPGIGRNKETGELVRNLIRSVKKPLVLDADGINAIEGEMDILKSRPASTVITPHPGEMARLYGTSAEHINTRREEIAEEVAKATGVFVCLKGHGTVVASPDGEVYVNHTGNSGMATGGTGDVLTGMIASFIGQGIDEYSAVIAAVYLHGLAGDIAVEDIGPFCLIATDLIDYLPEAFNKAGI